MGYGQQIRGRTSEFVGQFDGAQKIQVDHELDIGVNHFTVSTQHAR